MQKKDKKFILNLKNPQIHFILSIYLNFSLILMNYLNER